MLHSRGRDTDPLRSGYKLSPEFWRADFNYSLYHQGLAIVTFLWAASVVQASPPSQLRCQNSPPISHGPRGKAGRRALCCSVPFSHSPSPGDAGVRQAPPRPALCPAPGFCGLPLIGRLGRGSRATAFCVAFCDCLFVSGQRGRASWTSLYPRLSVPAHRCVLPSLACL